MQFLRKQKVLQLPKQLLKNGKNHFESAIPGKGADYTEFFCRREYLHYQTMNQRQEFSLLKNQAHFHLHPAVNAVDTNARPMRSRQNCKMAL